MLLCWSSAGCSSAGRSQHATTPSLQSWSPHSSEAWSTLLTGERLLLLVSPWAGEQLLTALASRCFEGALAAMAAPFVGWLAEHAFGLKGTVAPTGDPAVDLPKAQALASSLLLFTAVPWTLCLILYSGVPACALYALLVLLCRWAWAWPCS